MKTNPVELDNRGKPKSDYLAMISAMPNTRLYDETRSKIWLAAYAANNPRSDYHWHVDAIYGEWLTRNKLSEYARAYKEVASEN